MLIDEANTPLVVSGPTRTRADAQTTFCQARDLADRLKEGTHYVLDAKAQTIELTDEGLDRAFARVPERLDRPWKVYVEQALRAKLLMRREIDYVIADEQVRIVDQYTGRIFAERTWRDGLHQAVEAKENVPVTDENRPLARISRQRFFQLYENLCGMSGTVQGHETEFEQFYGLSVVAIPLRKPCIRQMGRARFFATHRDKLSAVVARIVELHQARHPVLVGTRTISASISLSKLLTQQQIPHQVLNGVQDEEEAHIIANAGAAGAVTIATNMAGRGTDIQLDAESRSTGGLHLLSLEFHDSRRIDRQLEGRAARQGDPGFAQFFASAEDDLFQQHAPDLADAIAKASSANGESPRDFSGAVRKLQDKVEREGFAQRRSVYRHQQWLDNVLSTIAEPTVSPSFRNQQGEAA